jgi:hypothetical protein
MKYLIWSEEHGRWWLHPSSGYTYSMELAYRFTKEEADKIVEEANRVIHPESGVRAERTFNEIAIVDPMQETLSKKTFELKNDKSPSKGISENIALQDFTRSLENLYALYTSPESTPEARLALTLRSALDSYYAKCERQSSDSHSSSH